MKTAVTRIVSPGWDEAGQTLVEYSLILALIALAAVGGITAFAGQTGGMYSAIKAVTSALLGGSSAGPRKVNARFNASPRPALVGATSGHLRVTLFSRRPCRAPKQSCR